MLPRRNKPRVIGALQTLLTCLVAWLIIAGSGCAHSAFHESLASRGRGGVQPGDVIDISFQHYPDLNQTQIVDSDGRVTFRLVDDIRVTGLSKADLESRLKYVYGKLLARPKLEVSIHKSSNFSVYFGGHIVKPGRLVYSADLTVARGIRLAGGLKISTGYDIYIFRSTGRKGLRKLKLEWSRESARPGQNKDMKLAPYDIVFVVKAPETRIDRGIEI